VNGPERPPLHSPAPASAGAGGPCLLEGWRKGPRQAAQRLFSCLPFTITSVFSLMIDAARAESLLIERHGRGVVMVISVEEYERLTARRDTSEEPEGLITEEAKR
jgi:prevent-host-death family protein